MKLLSSFKIPFFPLLLTVFMDSLGFGLIFPMLSTLVMSPENSLLPATFSLSTRGWVFGLLISTYCVGQFFGGPFLGRLSDLKGRKKILTATLYVACIAYFFGGLGVFFKNITFLFTSRLLSGIAAGNYVIAQSIIVDSATEENRAKDFSTINMAWGVGFIIGPYIGGKLIQYGFVVPFWFASVACLINVFLVIWKVKESLPHEKPLTSVWESLKNIKKGFQTPALRGLFLTMFIFSFGWGFFTDFSPLFLLKKLQFSVEDIANFYACVGIWIALCQGILIRPFLKRFSPHHLLKCAWLGLTFFLPLMLFCKNFMHVMWVIPLTAFTDSLIGPSSAALVSLLSKKENQGEMLGIHNSIQWAAIGLAPLFSGSLVALYPHLPISVSSLCMLAALLLFVFFYRSKKVFNNKEGYENSP